MMSGKALSSCEYDVDSLAKISRPRTVRHRQEKSVTVRPFVMTSSPCVNADPLLQVPHRRRCDADKAVAASADGRRRAWVSLSHVCRAHGSNVEPPCSWGSASACGSAPASSQTIRAPSNSQRSLLDKRSRTSMVATAHCLSRFRLSLPTSDLVDVSQH